MMEVMAMIADAKAAGQVTATFLVEVEAKAKVVPPLPEPEPAANAPVAEILASTRVALTFLAGFFSPNPSESSNRPPAPVSSDLTPDKIEIVLRANESGSYGMSLVAQETSGGGMVVESVDADSPNARVVMPDDAVISIDGVDVRRDHAKAMAQLEACAAKAAGTSGVACEIVRAPPSPSASPPPLPSPPPSPPEEPAKNAADAAASNTTAAARPHRAGVPEQDDGTEGVAAVANEQLRELHKKHAGQKLLRSFSARCGPEIFVASNEKFSDRFIVSFYLVLFVSVATWWIVSGAVGFALLFLPMAILNGMWFAFIYQVLIRVWLFSKGVIEQMHIQRVNKLLTLRNDLDNKIIELSKKERDGSKTSCVESCIGAAVHLVKSYTGQTVWIKEGKNDWLFLKKVYGRRSTHHPCRPSSISAAAVSRSRSPR